MRARLHVLIVLQCVVFGASCAVLLTFSVFYLFFFFSRTSQGVWFSLRILSVFVSSDCIVVWYSWVGPFVSGYFQVCSMTTPRSTFNNLSADLLPIVSTSTPPSSGDSVAITTASSGASNSLSNQIAVAVAHALQHSLPSFVLRVVQRTTPLQFPT